MKKDMSSIEQITFLIANYNNGKYLDDCIDTLLNQTDTNWRAIILDDCSPDNSDQYYAKYRNESRISFYYNQYNLGYIGSLKRLIDLAETEIVAILDPDDALELTAVEKFRHAYKDNPGCGFVYSNFWFCDENLNIKRKGFSKKIPDGKTNLDVNNVSHLKSFKRSDYFKTEGYDLSIIFAEDKDLIFKLEEVTSFYFIDEQLYLYRELPDSQSHGRNKKLSKRSYLKARKKAKWRRFKAKYLHKFNN